MKKGNAFPCKSVAFFLRLCYNTLEIRKRNKNAFFGGYKDRFLLWNAVIKD